MEGTQEQIAAAKVARLIVPETLSGIMTLHTADADANRCYDLNDQFHGTIILGAKNACLARNKDGR